MPHCTVAPVASGCMLAVTSVCQRSKRPVAAAATCGRIPPSGYGVPGGLHRRRRPAQERGPPGGAEAHGRRQARIRGGGMWSSVAAPLPWQRSSRPAHVRLLTRQPASLRRRSVYSIDERSAIRKSHENPSVRRLYQVGPCRRRRQRVRVEAIAQLCLARLPLPCRSSWGSPEARWRTSCCTRATPTEARRRCRGTAARWGDPLGWWRRLQV